MSRTATTKPKPKVARPEPVRLTITKSSPAPARARAISKSSASGEPRSKTERPTSKLSNLIELLRDKRGASIDQLAAATGWQKHSVRGALSGAIKKRLGLNIVSEQSGAGRVYRILK